MLLSPRLETLFNTVPENARVADIGTDHGYLAAALKKSGRAKSVIATDIRKSPLENARKHIENAGVDVSLRLSDGLEKVDESEADTIVIAGMGGDVISGILTRCRWKNKSGKLFILQPVTSPEVLREYLFSAGFRIENEQPVEDAGKLYTVMSVVFDGKKREFTLTDTFAGLITPESDAGRKYLEKQYRRVKKCNDELTAAGKDAGAFSELTAGLYEVLHGTRRNIHK